ncbi:hypothetical protein KKC17_03535 [Patescibacteria group bacterium]|nr:hypothetical protein [Patescibacteria group bacterium]
MSYTPLTPLSSELIQRLSESTPTETNDQPKIHVSEIASLPIFIYEKIRNFIDYKDEYLLRKNAVKRFLRRSFLLPNFKNYKSEQLALSLIRELILSRYLKNDSVLQSKIKELSPVLEKYYLLLQQTDNNQVKYPKWREAVLGLAAVECDSYLVSPQKRHAYIAFAFNQIKDLIKLPAGEADTETINVQILLNTQRILERADQDILGYYLLVHYYPNWFNLKTTEAANWLSPQLNSVLHNLKFISEQSLGKRVMPTVRKLLIPIVVLQQMLHETDKPLRDLLSDPTKLNEQIKKTYHDFWNKTRKKIRNKGFHAIFYIFITKMVLALLVEFPYEKIFLGQVHYLSLGINLLFPPLLMGLITILIKSPGKQNETRVAEAVSELIYGRDTGFYKIKELKPLKNNFWGKFFYALLYLITIISSFGLVITFLINLNFNILSGGFFILFISLVSFFGLSLRQQARQLRLINEKDTMLAFALDFFSLPVVTFGKWLSTTFDKLNVFVFILDFLFELPFKTLLKLIEQWFQFLREKRDQMY